MIEIQFQLFYIYKNDQVVILSNNIHESVKITKNVISYLQKFIENRVGMFIMYYIHITL